MSFKKAITATAILMAVSGFPISKKMRAKFIFKIIFILQIYGIFGRFYGIYLERCEVPPEKVNVAIHMKFMIYTMSNISCLHFAFLFRYFHAEIIVLIDKVDEAFAEMGHSTSYFLKAVSKHQKIWFLLLFVASILNFGSSIKSMVDGREITVRLVNQSLTVFNMVLLFSAIMLMIFAMMTQAFLFDHLTTFKIHHDRKRLAQLLKTHRKCCEISKLSDRIFNTVIADILLGDVFHLIGFFAFIVLRKWHLFEGGFVYAASWTMFYLTIFVYLSLLSANVNNKLNKSIDYILTVGTFFKSPVFTPGKSFALTAKLDLYVTHVQLSDCCFSNGGIIQIKNEHVVSMLGFMLSYVVLLLDKSTKEQAA